MKFDLSNVIIHDGNNDFDFGSGGLTETAVKDEDGRVFEMPFPVRELSGVTVLTYDDEAYPDSLRQIKNAPRELYCIGDVSLLGKPAIAMVGTRRPSVYGVNQAEKLAYEMAKAGFPKNLALERMTCASAGASVSPLGSLRLLDERI